MVSLLSANLWCITSLLVPLLLVIDFKRKKLPNTSVFLLFIRRLVATSMALAFFIFNFRSTKNEDEKKGVEKSLFWYFFSPMEQTVYA